MNWFPEPVQCGPDRLSGRSVTRWTRPGGLSQHLYFTSLSVTMDDRWLVFLSDRTGSANLFALDRQTHLCRQLTDNREGTRFAYCYPYGTPRGLARTTPSLDPVRNRVYALIDESVWRLDLDSGTSRLLWQIPAGTVPSFTHVSPDGRWLAFPLTNAAAFQAPARNQGEQMAEVAKQIDAGNVTTSTYLIDTETGAARVWFEVPFWLTHIQFDPTGSGRVIFNSEGHWDRQHLIPRIWVAEASGAYRPLFQQAVGEHLGHENFAADGTVVYHGHLGEQDYLAKRDLQGRLLEQRITPAIPIHHSTPDATGQGYIADAYDGLVYHITAAGETGMVATPLCRHDSENPAEQNNHAHAILSARGNSVIFTACRQGDRAVYEVALRSGVRWRTFRRRFAGRLLLQLRPFDVHAV